MKKKKNFTLLELFVVGSIIIIFLLLIYSTKCRGEVSYSAWCLAKLNGLGLSMSLYADANENIFPFTKKGEEASNHLTLLIKGKYAKKEIFICPVIKDIPYVNNIKNPIYVRTNYNYAVGLTSHNTTDSALMWDKDKNHFIGQYNRSGNVLLISGAAKAIKKKKWDISIPINERMK